MPNWLDRSKSPTDKRDMLRAALNSDSPAAFVGAQDAIGAALAEEYGFDGIWVSGFGVSAMQYGIPDANLVTLSEALEAARRVDQATDLPVIADCDNGYGGALNVRRTVVEYERAGIAGVCIEDNPFPKSNSLLQGDAPRDLIPTKEQANRLELAKSAQLSDGFVVIARIESLIAGYGVEDALERAEAYEQAGVDALLVHSKDKTLQEVDSFLAQWQGKLPLVAVPTLFPDFTVENLHSKGFQVVIFANQLMRASVDAMKSCLGELRATRKASSVDGTITPVNEIFDRIGTRESMELDARTTWTSPSPHGS